MDFKYLGARSRTGGKGPRQARGPERCRNVEEEVRQAHQRGKTTESSPPPNSQSAEREALEILFEAAPPKIPPTCSAVGRGGALIVGAGAAAEYD